MFRAVREKRDRPTLSTLTNSFAENLFLIFASFESLSINTHGINNTRFCSCSLSYLCLMNHCEVQLYNGCILKDTGWQLVLTHQHSKSTFLHKTTSFELVLIYSNSNFPHPFYFYYFTSFAAKHRKQTNKQQTK